MVRILNTALVTLTLLETSSSAFGFTMSKDLKAMKANGHMKYSRDSSFSLSMIPSNKKDGADGDEKKNRDTFLSAHGENMVDTESTVDNGAPRIRLEEVQRSSKGQKLNQFSNQDKLLAEALGLLKDCEAESGEHITSPVEDLQVDTTEAANPIEDIKSEEVKPIVSDSTPALKDETKNQSKPKQKPVSLAPPGLLEEMKKQKEIQEDESHVANKSEVPPGMRYSLYLKAIRGAKKMMEATKEKLQKEREEQVLKAYEMMKITEESTLENQQDLSDEWQ